MSWQQLIRIRDQSRNARPAQPVRHCPNDGVGLRLDAAGRHRCPFDGWVGENAEIVYSVTGNPVPYPAVDLSPSTESYPNI